ncbi:molybdopterin molybdotransferase MoeA [Streptomyces sp. DvalAA-14]|uniref:molybdopterin molybdotransferase MoeA n=1 Tax=Streptomyces sp. SID4948 TaxID=2690287 RepID=UPI002108B515|nr:molybdopterin molybdotransferase MoeA [Streptomyces sp. DvalAA-14]
MGEAEGPPGRARGSAGSRPRPVPPAPPPPLDPVAVALRHGQEESAPPRPPARSGKGGAQTSADSSSGDRPSARRADAARTPSRRAAAGRTSPGRPPEDGAPPDGEAAPRRSASRPEPPGPPVAAPHLHTHEATWPEARRIARQAARRLGPQVQPLGDDALGTALAEPLTALVDLPSFDSSAMDGWAVAGPGPWWLTGQLLAGQGSPALLRDGCAAPIATGAVLPPGAVAVLRSEHGRTEHRTDGTRLELREQRFAPRPGQEVRRRGQECRSGDELLPAGAVVTPAVLGLAAASGYDELTVTARPRVEVLVLGDELLGHGLPRKGRVRDALGPMLPSWLRALGAEVTSVRHLLDDLGAVREAISAGSADLIITTGGTAGGPVDHVHPVLAAIGAKLLVDGVAVRPGHPMLLAELPTPGPATAPARASAAVPGGGPFLIGLPGNPLAAAAGVLTLVAPLLRTLAGHRVPAPYAAPLTEDVAGHRVDTRLVPVVFDDDSAARPLRFAGSAMLRGLAAADGMAVIPPGGLRAGQETAVLDTGMSAAAWGSGG